MNSISIFNFIDLAIRLCIVILSLLTSHLLLKLDADVIRSRIYVSFKNLKKYFIFLTIGFLLYLSEALLSVNSIPGSMQHDAAKGIMLTIFQFSILVFLYHLYVAIRVPDRRIL
ncbi:hypothetical protein RE476_12310 [Methanolobus mangrovi]|uniref:Uncharacterized protein n=1 Tax=Methanolobus mangrovi TaxID=3072977 RepID=A0AA51UFE4_9EURY|nr:hypothetical protein [Methanolobus mangrovi]WMW22135.1 hypothetical protein RE476_12310 [Methanolobus mangrovi]